jgi:hypothetical protein
MGYWIVVVVVWGLLELNALGVIGGRAAGGLNSIYDTHQAAIITGFVLVVILYANFYIFFKS